MTDLWDPPNEENMFAMPGDEAFNPDNIADQETPAPAFEEPPPPPVDDRPRNPDGTFAPREPDPEPEPAEAAVEEPQAEAPEPAAEDPEVARYRKMLEDAQSFNGRLTNELGELRRMVEEQQAAPPQQQPQQQIDVTAAREWLDENPAQIQQVLVQAFEAGNDQLVAVALRAWEATGDEVGAEQARMTVATARAARAMEAQQQQAQQAQQQLTDRWRDAGQQFLAKHDDAEQYADGMMAAARDNPALGQLLGSNDPNAQGGALEALYALAKASGQPQAANLNVTAAEIARTQAIAADQAIKDATVASATSTVPQVPDRVAELTEGWDKYEDPLASGWNLG